MWEHTQPLLSVRFILAFVVVSVLTITLRVEGSALTQESCKLESLCLRAAKVCAEARLCLF
jgi:hypothetical protein